MTTLIVVAAIIIALLISSSYLCVNGDSGHLVAGLIAPCVFLISVGLACCYCVEVFNYVGANYKADILNREYGTQYTQDELYFADDVIETVRELDRSRIELNGNIIKGGE